MADDQQNTDGAGDAVAVQLNPADAELGGSLTVVGPDDHLIVHVPTGTTDTQAQWILDGLPDGVRPRTIVVIDPVRIEVERAAPVRPEEGKP